MLTLSDNYANLRPDADQQCSVRGMVSLLDVIPRYANTFQQIERLLLTLEDIAANPQSPLIPANGEHVGLPGE